MKGILWNSRGLSDLAKASFISDSVKEQNLEFVALLETGKRSIPNQRLIIFARVETLYGIGHNLTGDQGGFYWE
jgi:hypothetical protein